MKIVKENIVALTYLANPMKLILLASVLKHIERRAAARLHCASGGEVVVNLSCRNLNALVPGTGLHVAKHWLEWTLCRRLVAFQIAVCVLYSHNM